MYMNFSKYKKSIIACVLALGIGVGGEGHTTFTIAGPTGEGITCARSFCRIRRCVLSEAFSLR